MSKNKDQIKELIENGFELELISLELKIPIEYIKNVKKEMQFKNRLSTLKIKDNVEDNRTVSKIDQMRKRYDEIFKGKKEDSFNEQEQIRKLSEKEQKEIDLKIDKVEDIIKDVNEKNVKEKINEIASLIDIVTKYPLSIEQLERINNILQDNMLTFITRKISLKSSNISLKSSNILKRAKREVLNKLIQSIETAQSKTEDLEELKRLRKKITTKLENQNQIFISSLRYSIDAKITKLEQQRILRNMQEEEVSEELLNLAEDILNGKTDQQEANQIIDKEAKERISNRPKSKFALTEEREKQQIKVKIRFIMENYVKSSKIQDASIAISNLSRILETDKNLSVKTIIQMLINGKEFNRAKHVCNQLEENEEDSKEKKFIRATKNKVINAEIGDMILKVIKDEMTQEECETYFKMIENRLMQSNVKLSDIPLGKSEDGLKRISLADIWDKNIKKNEEQR